MNPIVMVLGTDYSTFVEECAENVDLGYKLVGVGAAVVGQQIVTWAIFAMPEATVADIIGCELSGLREMLTSQNVLLESIAGSVEKQVPG